MTESQTTRTHWRPELQCDCCGKMVHRLHFGEFSGMEYAACDACCDYEAEAYGEPTEDAPDAEWYAWLNEEPT